MYDWVPFIVETLMIVPFFGWGVYTVYLRFNRRVDPSILRDGLTCLAVVLFLAFQVDYLGMWIRGYRVEYMLAVLGLFIATAALYGHVFYGLITQVLMDVAHPTRDDESEPRWGAAEARERVDDFTGALAEYFKLLRTHPRHVLLNVRIADALVQLNRPQEAPPYLRMAIDAASTPDRELAAVNRLCDLYDGVLNESEKAERCLRDFMERNPRTKQFDVAQRRLERIELELEALPEPPLDSLVVHPVEERPDDLLDPDLGEPEILESLEEHPLYMSGPPDEILDELALRDARPDSVAVQPLAQTPFEDNAGDGEDAQRAAPPGTPEHSDRIERM